jgi:hypothetical protein
LREEGRLEKDLPREDSVAVIIGSDVAILFSIIASLEAEGSKASLAQAIFDCLGALARTRTLRMLLSTRTQETRAP